MSSNAGAFNFFKRKETFSFYASKYLQLIENKSPKTKALVQYLFDKHLLPYFGNKIITEITIHELKQYINSKSKKLKVYNHLKYFKAVINVAREMDVPVRAFIIACPDNISEKHKVYLPNEISMMLKNLKFKYQWNLRLQIYIAWTMGLRKSEILGLRWEFIDFKEGVLRLPANFQKKTKRTKFHEMPINKTVLRILKARYSRRERGEEYVFPKRGGVGSQTDLDRSWSRLLKRIGLSGTFHSLRGTCASQLCNAGIQVPIVCKLLRMTEDVLRRHYLQIDMPLARFAVDYAGKIARQKPEAAMRLMRDPFTKTFKKVA